MTTIQIILLIINLLTLGENYETLENTKLEKQLLEKQCTPPEESCTASHARRLSPVGDALLPPP